MSPGRVIIVGAGPCGLGCSRELVEGGHDDLVVLEASAGPGGLAASIVDPAGFTWDRGGHVVFSHYGEFDRLLDEVMGADVAHHDRSSYIHVDGSWVPYPFQNNLHRLSPANAQEALVGLISAGHGDDSSDGSPTDFGRWMLRTFGEGICRQFMRPYNEKVWAWPAEQMSATWIAERVSVPDWRTALGNLIHQSDDVAWGPNNRFAFPAVGGTGEIYRRAAEAVRHHIRYLSSVVSVDARSRTVTLGDGSVHDYGSLVWTGPLDRLVDALVEAPPEVREAARSLVHNSVTVVGIGYETPLTDDRSWLYFPGEDVPFYRATNFAKYAAANVPRGDTGRFSSWMTEIASSPHRPLDEGGLGARVDSALRRLGLVPDDAPIASVHVDHVVYGYPVPTLDRDRALGVIQPWLMSQGILSRGRFGAWRYELGNMDHAVKQGIDAARRILTGQPEEAWTT